MHDDPIAFFFTWPTYGTWLPGDQRGWIEYRQGWQLPDPVRRIESRVKMTEDACILTQSEREIVETQAVETCRYRGWTLYAVNCRSNHIHLVVGAVDTHPRKIRIDIKSWTNRRLKERSNPGRTNWWAERGSERYINTEEQLHRAIQYTLEAQDQKARDHQPDA